MATTSGATPQQRLVTATTYSTDKYRLLELNPDVEQALTTGDKVVIVGGSKERAVLCTSSKSFYLTKEDMSNLRLLTEHSKWEEGSGADEIVMKGSAGFHYVLQPRVPDITMLKTLLLEAPYKKPMGSSPSSSKRARLHKLYTTDALMAKLQASKQELLDMLEQLCAFEDAGSWRVLDPDYQMSVFGDILHAIVQNDWDFQAGVPLQQLLAAVDEPTAVVRQCCRVYGSITKDDNGEKRATFDCNKIAMFYAKQLFMDEKENPHHTLNLGASEDWQLDYFMEKWQMRVPEPVKVSVDMLKGIALLKTQRSKPTRLIYFLEDELPMDPKLRFDKLFEVQEKWTIDQLEPYISALVRPGVTQASLLVKFARSSRQANSNERLYSKR
ncbi:hypothetical protein Poli38472_010539 [Pythium oligandrum]|uniref:Sister chromatid cohesion protein DCC1 n=1 Tax=Pythium oligandrum TaxID=41045 RepID=A0A8K1C3A2_PYTOL|nr:hypothetical protein Poli38472_010539 [Pythium oligandrum]|eukprot:TMW55657.1 hypothetical protein Poli38472_010539 [Pythium oligandrum]